MQYDHRNNLQENSNHKLQNDIIFEARKWLGTPFRHQGRTMKTLESRGGVDCLGLIIGVADSLRLRAKNGQNITNFDQKNYSKKPDENILFNELNEHCTQVKKEEISAGDIGLFYIDGAAQHLVIFSSSFKNDLTTEKNSTIAATHNKISSSPIITYPTIIHSYAPAKKVVEHRIDKQWMSQLKCAFRMY